MWRSGRARDCYAAGREFDPGSSLEAFVQDSRVHPYKQVIGSEQLEYTLQMLILRGEPTGGITTYCKSSRQSQVKLGQYGNLPCLAVVLQDVWDVSPDSWAARLKAIPQ